tara:strand:+ start:1157 stop:1837 length:681 start_codon:yes stop_codon:yes gene_type:complete
MNLQNEKYKKITKLKKKYKFSDFEIITNYGLFSGNTNLFKTLKVFELIKKIKKLDGDIIELGVHKGNNSLLIKKILDIFKIKKKIFLLDHFSGLKKFTFKDPKKSLAFKGRYKSNINQLNDFIKFFKFKNIKIINTDAEKLKPNLFRKYKFSLIYLDMDLYKPTKISLQILNKNLVKNGLIVFDQGNSSIWGESKAAKEFIKKNKNFKISFKDNFYQPNLVIKKIN